MQHHTKKFVNPLLSVSHRKIASGHIYIIIEGYLCYVTRHGLCVQTTNRVTIMKVSIHTQSINSNIIST